MPCDLLGCAQLSLWFARRPLLVTARPSFSVGSFVFAVEETPVGARPGTGGGGHYILCCQTESEKSAWLAACRASAAPRGGTLGNISQLVRRTHPIPTQPTLNREGWRRRFTARRKRRCFVSPESLPFLAVLLPADTSAPQAGPGAAGLSAHRRYEGHVETSASMALIASGFVFVLAGGPDEGHAGGGGREATTASKR